MRLSKPSRLCKRESHNQLTRWHLPGHAVGLGRGGPSCHNRSSKERSAAAGVSYKTALECTTASLPTRFIMYDSQTEHKFGKDRRPANGQLLSNGQCSLTRILDILSKLVWLLFFYIGAWHCMCAANKKWNKNRFCVVRILKLYTHKRVNDVMPPKKTTVCSL